MDAVKFIEERNRMHLAYPGCDGCPANAENGFLCAFSLSNGETPAKQIELVEKWSAAHPSKTRQSVFLEQWPEAELTKDGVISICPIAVSAAYRNKTGGCTSPTRPQCDVCRREFWGKAAK